MGAVEYSKGAGHALLRFEAVAEPGEHAESVTMTLNPWSRIVSLWPAIAITGMAIGAVAFVSFNLMYRSIIIPGQAVNRAAKADRLELPDVAITVTRGDKADSRLKPVATQVVLGSGLTDMDGPVLMTGSTSAVGNSGLSPLPARIGMVSHRRDRTQDPVPSGT